MTVFGVATTTPQYWDHLRPVWDALSLAERGEVVVLPQTKYVNPVTDAAPGSSLPPQYWMTSSYRDSYAAEILGMRPLVRFDHGIGLYGGTGAGCSVKLFACQNQFVYDGHNQGRVRCEIVGTPKMDLLAAIPHPRNGAPVVGMSVHWTAQKPFVADWAKAANALARGGEFEVLAHAHPRAQMDGALERIGDAEIVPDFIDVVRRADVYVIDNSSTMYEWAALDRPVVILDRPAVRASEMRDLYPVGVHCNLQDLAAAISTALEDDEERVAERAAIREGLYPYWGCSVQRTLEVLRSLP